jgi:putative transposase
VLKAYKYRIYPTEEQQSLLNQQFGIGRFIFNWALNQKQEEYKKLKEIRKSDVGDKPKYRSLFDYHKLLPELKKDFPWIKDAHSQAIQQEITHLFHAFERFYTKVKERKTRRQKLTNKKGKLLDFPKFKSRKDRQSLSFPQSVKVDFQSSRVQIPKLGKVSCLFHREFTGTIKTTTVSKTTTGKYYVAILVENGIELPCPMESVESSALGIDVGLTHFATLSDGTKIKNPRKLKHSLSKLRRVQRSMARKKNRASVNYGKAKLRRALLEEKVANQRKDFLHQTTHQLVCDSQATTFCVEDLSVKNMMQNRKLARSIADVSWSEFFRQLKYKAQWSGKQVIEIGRFVPSSKTCSHCGSQVDFLPLNIRKWECPGCGVEHDRDLNAAKNLVKFAFAKIPVGQPELPKIETFGNACGCVTSASPCLGSGMLCCRSRKACV